MAGRRGKQLPAGWQGIACAHYAQGHSLTKCAQEAGLSLHTLIVHRDENINGFGDQLRAAGETFNDAIRDEIVERAFDRDHRGSDMWLERIAQWRLPEFKLAKQQQEDDRADQLAEALDRFAQLVAARTVPPALEPGADGAAGDADR